MRGARQAILDALRRLEHSYGRRIFRARDIVYEAHRGDPSSPSVPL
jgi:hypothetical protein